MTINSKNNTIELTKAEAKASSTFGTQEYKDLQEIRRDYPTYRIITLKSSRKNDKFKGLTKQYIENYIAEHDDANQTNWNTYQILIGEVSAEKNDTGVAAFGAKANFFDIKEWFLNTYPEIEEYAENSEKKIKGILTDAKKAAAERARKKAA